MLFIFWEILDGDASTWKTNCLLFLSLFISSSNSNSSMVVFV